VQQAAGPAHLSEQGPHPEPGSSNNTTPEALVRSPPPTGPASVIESYTSEIALVTLFSFPRQQDAEVYEKLYSLSLENKLNYAHTHSIPLFYAHDFNLDPTKDAQWSKILVVQHYLKHFKWVMWVDADAFVMNLKSPAALMDDTVDMIAARDHNGLNSGVFLIRQSRLAFEFLKTVWDSYPRHRGSPLFEQTALEEAALNLRGIFKLKFVSPCAINTYMPHQDMIVPPQNLFRPGCFILHAAGLVPFEKLKMAKYFAIPSLDRFLGTWGICVQRTPPALA